MGFERRVFHEFASYLLSLFSALLEKMMRVFVEKAKVGADIGRSDEGS